MLTMFVISIVLNLILIFGFIRATVKAKILTADIQNMRQVQESLQLKNKPEIRGDIFTVFKQNFHEDDCPIDWLRELREISATIIKHSPRIFELDTELANRLIHIDRRLLKLGNFFGDGRMTHMSSAGEKLAVTMKKYTCGSGCSLISMDKALDEFHLNKLPIKTNSAYVRVQNELYYFCKSKGKCFMIGTSESTRASFDKELLPDMAARILTEAELMRITAITGHTRGK